MTRRLDRRARTIRAALRRHASAQVVLLILVWVASEAVSALLARAVPGTIIGMAALLVLLASGAIDVRSVRLGAAWLIAEMLLFFVPATVALLDYPEFLGALGLKLLGIILGGTLLVMLVTGLVVVLLLHRRGDGDPA